MIPVRGRELHGEFSLSGCFWLIGYNPRKGAETMYYQLRYLSCDPLVVIPVRGRKLVLIRLDIEVKV